VTMSRRWSMTVDLGSVGSLGPPYGVALRHAWNPAGYAKHIDIGIGNRGDVVYSKCPLASPNRIES